LISKPTKGGNLRVRICVSQCLRRWWNFVDVSTSLRRGFRHDLCTTPWMQHGRNFGKTTRHNLGWL
jgi:hypothetical protein